MNKKLGSVYTPDLLADWVATELLNRLPRNRRLLIIDPACGDGALLRSIDRIKGATHVDLAGFDIDANAIRQAALSVPTGTTLKCTDALQSNGHFPDIKSRWDQILDTRTISGVISNPPWGAELQQTAAELRKTGYLLAQGQFDSYDLFIELCLRIAPDRSVLAFIIPDSIFFPEHKALRSLLLSTTQLHLIARLGEGFFGDVYRGTAVIVCEKGIPRFSRPVECLRLQKKHREQVMAKQISFETAKAELGHRVPQRYFQADAEKRFIIDVSREDMSFFQQIHTHRNDWTSWLTSGRGVELSKTGAIVFCPNCHVARPEPRERTRITCEDCGKTFTLETAKRKRIIRKSLDVPLGWKRLIVGEDVDRYICDSSRIIEANISGINYKTPEAFKGAKLLVRKTGVGLKAAIDDSEALTNQVVFHYRPKSTITPTFFLDFVLGVLCSRVMLAYHLKRTGENEWRSHPYVTQKTIAELPVPAIAEGQPKWRQAKAIADAVRKRRNDKHRDKDGDLHIDSLVAGLYDFNQKGCAWVLKVLEEAQSLQAITTMRALPGQLSSVKV